MADCSECGASSRRGKLVHAGGCSQGEPKKKASEKGTATSGPKNKSGHKHNYRTTGKKASQDANDLILTEYQHCDVPGCPQPDYENVTRTPKKKKAHEHTFKADKQWSKRGVHYLQWKCTFPGCTETKTTHS